MAIIRLSPPFDAYHGTTTGISGNSKLVVFSSGKSPGVARQWVKPANPQSTRQMAMRADLIDSATSYKVLTPANAKGWRDAAAELNYTNILHLPYEISGISLYCMVNSYRQIRGQSVTDVCPAIVTPPTPTAVTSVTWAATPTLTIVAQVPGLSDADFAMVRVTPPLSSAVRQARANDMRLIGDPIATSIEHPSSGVATWVRLAVGTTWAVDDRVGVEVTPLSVNHFPGPKYLEPNIVIV